MQKTADAILMNQSNSIFLRSYQTKVLNAVTDIAEKGLTTTMVESTANILKSITPIIRDGKAIDLMAIFRTPNPDSLKWINLGHIMKTMEIKAKTLSDIDFYLNPNYLTMASQV